MAKYSCRLEHSPLKHGSIRFFSATFHVCQVTTAIMWGVSFLGWKTGKFHWDCCNDKIHIVTEGMVCPLACWYFRQSRNRYQRKLPTGPFGRIQWHNVQTWQCSEKSMFCRNHTSNPGSHHSRVFHVTIYKYTVILSHFSCTSDQNYGRGSSFTSWTDRHFLWRKNNFAWPYPMYVLTKW
jgi:hypothetical protein